MIKKIVILAGDPNSINTEIIFKTWKKLNKSIKRKLCIVGSFNLINKQFKILKFNIKLNKLNNIEDKIDIKKINILNIDLKFIDPFKVSKISAMNYVKNSLNFAHKLSSKKIINGFINCPINKTILPKENGVTEYLAKKCKIKKDTEVMLIKSKNFSVAPLTTHINVSQVSRKIKANLIKKKIYTYNNWFKKIYNKKPKIGVLGLNPHNSELRKTSEEYKVIRPTIRYLKKKGFKIEGPLIADTVFIDNFKNYNVIFGMFHDQVLAPFKSLFKFEGINITLGLKYWRASPDHGVAINLIKKNKSNPSSLLECVYFFNSLK